MKGAFTLVELLVAITVSAIVMGAAVFALSAGMRAHARIASADTRALGELNLFRLLQHDISSATPFGPGARFTGDATQMSFTCLISIGNTTNNIVPARVLWRINPQLGTIHTHRILAYETTLYGIPPNSPPVARSVGNKTFAYRDSKSPQWLDTWDSPEYPAQVRFGETVFTLWTTEHAKQ